MTPDQKKYIDNLSYTSMLSLWRNSPVGEPLFQGSTGDYFAKRMSEERERIGNRAHVSASKSIGWEK